MAESRKLKLNYHAFKPIRGLRQVQDFWYTLTGGLLWRNPYSVESLSTQHEADDWYEGRVSLQMETGLFTVRWAKCPMSDPLPGIQSESLLAVRTAVENKVAGWLDHTLWEDVIGMFPDDREPIRLSRSYSKERNEYNFRTTGGEPISSCACDRFIPYTETGYTLVRQASRAAKLLRANANALQSALDVFVSNRDAVRLGDQLLRLQPVIR